MDKLWARFAAGNKRLRKEQLQSVVHFYRLPLDWTDTKDELLVQLYGSDKVPKVIFDDIDYSDQLSGKWIPIDKKETKFKFRGPQVPIFSDRMYAYEEEDEKVQEEEKSKDSSPADKEKGNATEEILQLKKTIESGFS